MLDATIQEAALDLGRALRQMPAVSAFRRATEALDADRGAQELLADLREQQGTLARLQRSGLAVSQQQIDSFRLCQQAVQANPTIMAHLRASNEVRPFLPAVGAQISATLGLDYGRLVANSSC